MVVARWDVCGTGTYKWTGHIRVFRVHTGKLQHLASTNIEFRAEAMASLFGEVRWHDTEAISYYAASSKLLLQCAFLRIQNIFNNIEMSVLNDSS